MSSEYRIKGARYLRKYTAESRTTTTSFMADVRKIANNLCECPWEAVKGDVEAVTAMHTEDTLDWNTEERDRLDAAEWCAEHADEMHRAYAQAACYVFKLPTSAVGKTIEQIKLDVTSDPYNPYGARIAAKVSSTLTIPTDCTTVRTGDVYRAPDSDGLGAAPRLYVTNTDGTETWYANMETVTLTPGTTLAAAQYLFIFVCLENYNRGRDGWIEGSSYIFNDVKITFDSACADLDATELNDLSTFRDALDYVLVDKGFTSTVAAGGYTGLRTLTLNARGAQGLMTAYHVLLEGGGEIAKSDTFGLTHGACWRVKPTDNGWECEVGALVVPFVMPNTSFGKLKFTFDSLNMTSGAVYKVYLYPGYVDGASDDLYKSGQFWDGVGSLGDWTHLGDISSGTTAEFKVPYMSGSYATVVVVGWLAPELVNQASGSWQGTGEAFRPKIEVV